MARKLYGLFVCILYNCLFCRNHLEPKRKKPPVFKLFPFLKFSFNFSNFFQYILDETFYFLFKLVYGFKMYLLFEKRCLKMFRFKKRGAKLYVLFQQSQNFIPTDLPKLGSQYGTYFVWNCHHTKKEPEVGMNPALQYS